MTQTTTLPKISEESLYNLDITLSKIIRDYLIKFKNMERSGIIYSHSYEIQGFSKDLPHENHTEWFLDEMIWTFDTIANEGETPEIEELSEKVYSVRKDTLQETLYAVRKNENYETLYKMEKEVSNRIEKNLILFARYFRRLWD